MIVTVERAIQVALSRSVRDLPNFAADHKAWVTDVQFTPPADTYLRVANLPNGNERLFMNGRDAHRYQGILQLSVIAPRSIGAYNAKLIGAELAKLYAADKSYRAFNVRVMIQKAPDVLEPFLDEAWWNVPVSIRYQAFASPTLTGVGMLDFSIAGNSQYIPLI